MFLLDINVVSELRRLRPHGAVVAWLSSVPTRDGHICAHSIAEFQIGVERTRERDPARAIDLDRWVDEVVAEFNVLALDAQIFRAWAELKQGRSNTPERDAIIVATAAVRGMIVAARNVRDFEALDARVINPFVRGAQA
jgi:predicted nucleic acid-binding protein